MIRHLSRLAPVIITLFLALPARAQPAPQQRGAAPAVERSEQPRTLPSIPVTTNQDAGETRQGLEELLRRLPPSVGQVMRIDPSLMRSPDYLAAYPTLAAFLQGHPDVVQNPGYYLAHVNYETLNSRQPDPRVEAISLWRDLMQSLTIAATLVAGALGLLWMLKTLLDYRRWHRTSKVQTEVHTKLLDRFSSNEDLMAYMQTPAGRRFLESAPLPMEGPARPVGAPFSRILWSLQAGVVLATGGIGVLFVSGRVIEEVAQALFAVGVVVLALGAGFVISAAASFFLSRRLGLLDAPASSREVSGLSGS